MKKPKFIAALSLLFAPILMGIAPGKELPTGLTAKNQDGKEIRFDDYKGKFLLVYFYPKDETPGCTQQACDLRDRHAKLKELNTVVFGVSRQDGKSHKQFIAKHKLPFDLLVDSDGKLGEAFGVGSYPIVGFSKRQSILVGPDGKVLKFYDSVDAAKHADVVLGDIEAAMPKKK